MTIIARVPYYTIDIPTQTTHRPKTMNIIKILEVKAYI